MNRVIIPYRYIEERSFITEFYIPYLENDEYGIILYNEIKRSLDPAININRIPIIFYIDSTGGNMYIALRIAKEIISSQIHTIAYGSTVISSATSIFVSCKERYLFRDNYTFMMHNLTTNDKIKKDSIAVQIDEIETKRYYIYEIINIFILQTNVSVFYLIEILSGSNPRNDYFHDDDIINTDIAYLI